MGSRETTPAGGGGTGETTASSEADGVLVASVWRTAGGPLLVRVTTTRPGGGDTVRTFASAPEALAHMEQWLTTLEGQG